jgi:SAM-dependent methyltransferase
MWDERYGQPGFAYGTEPNDFLRAEYARMAVGRVLCLADGEGRNSVFLAEQGYLVTAVDASGVGVTKTGQLAIERGVTVDAHHADLRDFDLGEAQWDGIVSIFCHLPPPLRREVHARVVRALKPGGVLILEAYTPDQVGRGTGGPPVAAAMMSEEILRDELAGLVFDSIVECEREVIEGAYHTGTASVVQVIARRPLV